MRSTVACLVVFAGVVAATTASAQNTPAPAAGTDVYHVHFAKAAPGQAAALGQSLMIPDKTLSMPEHFVVLRHQEGDDWDYVVIQHLGSKAEVTATAPPPPGDPTRALNAWHNDTFVSGPSWGEFTKQMGIGGRECSGHGVHRWRSARRPRPSRATHEIADRSRRGEQDRNRQRLPAARRRRGMDVRDDHPVQLLAGPRQRPRGRSLVRQCDGWRLGRCPTAFRVSSRHDRRSDLSGQVDDSASGWRSGPGPGLSRPRTAGSNHERPGRRDAENASRSRSAPHK